MSVFLASHKKLEVWKEAIDLAEDTFRLTESFPKREIFGLSSQIRRSAVSVPSNIAEGAGRKSDRDYLRFLSIASGSLSELDTQLLLAEKLEYFPEQNSVFERMKRVSYLLSGLEKYLRRSIKTSR